MSTDMWTILKNYLKNSSIRTSVDISVRVQVFFNAMTLKRHFDSSLPMVVYEEDIRNLRNAMYRSHSTINLYLTYCRLSINVHKWREGFLITFWYTCDELALVQVLFQIWNGTATLEHWWWDNFVDLKPMLWWWFHVWHVYLPTHKRCAMSQEYNFTMTCEVLE